MLLRERLRHFDDRKIGRSIPRIADRASPEAALRDAAFESLACGHCQFVIRDGREERWHRRQLVAQRHRVEVAARHGVAATLI